MEPLYIVAVVTIFALREWQHYKERHDLLNRLMARDYSEYTYSKTEYESKPSRNFVLESLEKAHQSRLHQYDNID